MNFGFALSLLKSRKSILNVMVTLVIYYLTSDTQLTSVVFAALTGVQIKAIGEEDAAKHMSLKGNKK
jgi:hypothetical protein